MGRPAQIDRALVLDEALALADERGLGALTMAGLARRLDVTAMALYRHVSGKDDLINGLVELLLVEAVPSNPELAWCERLSDIAHQLRATALRHPSVFALVLQRPAVTAQARHARDEISTALVAAGIAPQQADSMQRVLSTAILGFALSEVAGRFRALTREERDNDFKLLLELLASSVQTRVEG